MKAKIKKSILEYFPKNFEQFPHFYKEQACFERRIRNESRVVRLKG